MTDKISLQMARNVMLAAQGLDRSPDQPAVKADVLKAVRRMYLLQIDTIHVVARSPYLVLWSRLGDYEPEWLDELGKRTGREIRVQADPALAPEAGFAQAIQP